MQQVARQQNAVKAPERLNKIFKQMRLRHSQGSSFVELAVGMLALIPIALVILDLCIIIVSVQQNDAACREASRVAGSGNPLDAQTRAMTIVERANSQNQLTHSNFSLVSVTSSVTSADVTALSATGGPVKGTVAVETEVLVHPAVVQWINLGNPMSFRSQQTFPYTYVVPASGNGNPTPTNN